MLIETGSILTHNQGVSTERSRDFGPDEIPRGRLAVTTGNEYLPGQWEKTSGLTLPIANRSRILNQRDEKGSRDRNKVDNKKRYGRYSSSSMVSKTPFVASDSSVSFGPAEMFLARLYAEIKGGAPRAGMSTVFKEINGLLLHDKFSACDAILRSVDVTVLPENVLLAFLTFTFAARGRLSARRKLLHQIEERLIVDRGADVAAAMLKTLK